MKPLRIKLPKPLHEDLQRLSFKREKSLLGLALQAIQEFIARLKAQGEL